MARAKAAPTPADVVAGDSLQLLGALTFAQWDALRGLAVAHTSGSISLQAWRSASSAVIIDAFQRVQSEGVLSFADAG